MDLPRRILVVDDDEDAVKLIRSQLLMYDFEVDDLSDPTKVIAHLHDTNDYGLFIIDVNMPGKDGITLATQIRSTFRSTVPILFVSGDISDETANRIRRLKLRGHVEFLKKGEFDSRTLFNECMAMLKEHHQAKTMQELKGRLGHLQENLGEGMSKITDFISDFKKTPLVTTSHCEEKVKALIQQVQSTAIGVAISKSKAKIDDELKPESLALKIAAIPDETLAPKIESALPSEVAFKKVRSATSWKIAIYFILVIFGGLCIFWGTMWNKAEHADGKTRLLEEKHKQVIQTMQAQTKQIQKLLDVRPIHYTSVGPTPRSTL